jgi:hypothetical protein
MREPNSRWDDKVWGLPLSNELIAAMLNEFLAQNDMDGGIKVDLVTRVDVAPESGLVTFYFTHTRPWARVLQLVPPAEQPKPRRIPVRVVKNVEQTETETEQR